VWTAKCSVVQVRQSAYSSPTLCWWAQPTSVESKATVTRGLVAGWAWGTAKVPSKSGTAAGARASATAPRRR
jgi:hypothetical protein